MLEQNPNKSIAISVGIITAITIGISVFYWYKRRNENKAPIAWRRVGELSDIVCYPIKSCGPIRTKEIECSQIGIADGFLRDRIFVVVRDDGNFVTARKHTNLVLIQPKIVGAIMKLSAPGMMDFEIDLKKLSTLKSLECSVWSQKVKGIDVGDEAARWFSRYILSEDNGLRLIYYPHESATRDVRPNNKTKAMTKEDTGAFHDATSYMMVNESSVIALNTRLENPTTLSNFRPNFVVKGALEYEEDTWKWVKIGEDTIFRNLKPCTRCTFVNINPETAARSPDGNPLKELKLFRTLPETGNNPVMGIHLGVRSFGKINVGDPVYVECNI